MKTHRRSRRTLFMFDEMYVYGRAPCDHEQAGYVHAGELIELIALSLVTVDS